jgi:hypothetical protein
VRRGSEVGRRLSLVRGLAGNLNMAAALKIKPENAIFKEVKRVVDQMSKEEVLEKGKSIIR